MAAACRNAATGSARDPRFPLDLRGGDSAMLARMGVEFAGATDVGRKRDHNEDSLLVMPEHSLAVVCDGTGGHGAGGGAPGTRGAAGEKFFGDVDGPAAHRASPAAP